MYAVVLHSLLNQVRVRNQFRFRNLRLGFNFRVYGLRLRVQGFGFSVKALKPFQEVDEKTPKCWGWDLELTDLTTETFVLSEPPMRLGYVGVLVYGLRLSGYGLGLGNWIFKGLLRFAVFFTCGWLRCLILQSSGFGVRGRIVWGWCCRFSDLDLV